MQLICIVAFWNDPLNINTIEQEAEAVMLVINFS